MNDSALHNSYKCYDSIPTPSPTGIDESKQGNDFMHQSFSAIASSNNNTTNLLRTASLDSLINSSEQDGSSEDDELSDSDSLTELKHISLCDNSKNIDEPRKSDIEGLKNCEPPKEPVIKAYLEKCHKKCEYKNCCFKKPDNSAAICSDSYIDDNHNNNNNNIDNINNNCNNNNNCNQVQSSQNHREQKVVKSNLNTRRNSIASSISASRMETIHEEPIEPKVSVKEILARFETLREAAEV
jgi:hypothetical protein